MLTRSFKKLSNSIRTVLNNKARYSIPPIALQPSVNPYLPIISASKLFQSGRSFSTVDDWQRLFSQLPPIRTFVFTLFDCKRTQLSVFLRYKDRRENSYVSGTSAAVQFDARFLNFKYFFHYILSCTSHSLSRFQIIALIYTLSKDFGRTSLSFDSLWCHSQTLVLNYRI